jgi:hypothetical protein
MVFIETSLFSKLLRGYLGDDEYRSLQNHLIEYPDAGDVIRASGGVRKAPLGIRWQGKVWRSSRHLLLDHP